MFQLKQLSDLSTQLFSCFKLSKMLITITGKRRMTRRRQRLLNNLDAVLAVHYEAPRSAVSSTVVMAPRRVQRLGF